MHSLNPNQDHLYTIQQIALATQKSQSHIMERIKREKWPVHSKLPKRKQRLFHAMDLPIDVRCRVHPTWWPSMPRLAAKSAAPSSLQWRIAA